MINPFNDSRIREVCLIGQLVSRRVELNALIRQWKMVVSAIPLMADKPWARSWKSTYARQYNRSIRRAQVELAKIEGQIGPPPKFFRPRQMRDSAKLKRLYDPEDTPNIPWRAYVKLAKRRAKLAHYQSAAEMPSPVFQ